MNVLHLASCIDPHHSPSLVSTILTANHCYHPSPYTSKSHPALKNHARTTPIHPTPATSPSNTRCSTPWLHRHHRRETRGGLGPLVTETVAASSTGAFGCAHRKPDKEEWRSAGRCLKGCRASCSVTCWRVVEVDVESSAICLPQLFGTVTGGRGYG